MDRDKLIWIPVTVAIIISLIGGYIYLKPSSFKFELKNSGITVDYKEGVFTVKDGRLIVLRDTYNIECLDDGRYKKVYKSRGEKYSNLSYAKYGNVYSIKQEIYHSKGTLTRYFDVLDSNGFLIKESYKWEPKNPSEKCRLRIKYSKIKNNLSRKRLFYKGTGNTSLKIWKDIFLSWSPDSEKITSVWSYSNRNIQILTKPMVGKFFFDPLVGSSTSTEEIESLTRRDFLLKNITNKIILNGFKGTSDYKNLNLKCVSQELKSGFEWNYSLLEPKTKRACLYHIKLSQPTRLSDVFITNLNKDQGSIKKIQYFVPFTENGKKIAFEVTDLAEYKEPVSDFYVNFVMYDKWKKTHVGIGIGNHSMLDTPTKHQADKKVIYIDPYMFNGENYNSINLKLAKKEYHDNFENTLEHNIVALYTFDNSNIRETTLEPFDYKVDVNCNGCQTNSLYNTQGSSSMETICNPSYGTNCRMDKFYDHVDFSGYKYFGFDLYVENLTNVSQFVFYIRSNDTSWAHYTDWGFGSSLFKPGWNRIIFNATPERGTYFNNVTAIRFRGYISGNVTYYLDNFFGIEDYILQPDIGRGNITFVPYINLLTDKAGKFGKGMDMDLNGQENDVVEVKELSGFNDGKTVCLWFKPEISSSRSRFLFTPYWLTVYYDGHSSWMKVFSGDGSHWSSGSYFGPNANFYTKWHFLCITDDGLDVNIYLDGTKKATHSSAGLGEPSDHLLKLSTTSEKFSGFIDNLIILNRSLTSEEIFQLYTNNFSLAYTESYPDEHLNESPSSFVVESNNNINLSNNAIVFMPQLTPDLFIPFDGGISDTIGGACVEYPTSTTTTFFDFEGGGMGIYGSPHVEYSKFSYEKSHGGTVYGHYNKFYLYIYGNIVPDTNDKKYINYYLYIKDQHLLDNLLNITTYEEDLSTPIGTTYPEDLHIGWNLISHKLDPNRNSLDIIAVVFYTKQTGVDPYYNMEKDSNVVDYFYISNFGLVKPKTGDVNKAVDLGYSYINCSNNENLTGNQITIGFSINPTWLVSNTTYLIYKGKKDYAIQLVRPDTIRIQYGNGTDYYDSNSDISGLNLTGWHNFIVYIDKESGQIIVYEDGELKYYGTTDPMPDTKPDDDLLIGYGINDSYNYTGGIDNLFISTDKVFTTNELEYLSKSNNFETIDFGYYDENSSILFSFKPTRKGSLLLFIGNSSISINNVSLDWHNVKFSMTNHQYYVSLDGELYEEGVLNAKKGNVRLGSTSTVYIDNVQIYNHFPLIDDDILYISDDEGENMLGDYKFIETRLINTTLDTYSGWYELGSNSRIKIIRPFEDFENSFSYSMWINITNYNSSSDILLANTGNSGFNLSFEKVTDGYRLTCSLYNESGEQLTAYKFYNFSYFNETFLNQAQKLTCTYNNYNDALEIFLNKDLVGFSYKDHKIYFYKNNVTIGSDNFIGKIKKIILLGRVYFKRDLYSSSTQNTFTLPTGSSSSFNATIYPYVDNFGRKELASCIRINLTNGTSLGFIGNYDCWKDIYCVLGLPMEEGSGLYTYDSSGSGYNYSINRAKWGRGKINKGLNFNGVDNYIDLGIDKSYVFSEPFTICLWAKFNNFTDNKEQYIFHNGYKGDISLMKSSGNELYVFIQRSNGSTYTVGSASNMDGWNHYCVTYEINHTIRLFINGILNGSQISNISLKNLDDSNIFTIGAYINSTDEFGFFNGTIDEIYLWNRDLSSSEIEDFYNYSRGIHPILQPTKRYTLSATVLPVDFE